MPLYVPNDVRVASPISGESMYVRMFPVEHPSGMMRCIRQSARRGVYERGHKYEGLAYREVVSPEEAACKLGEVILQGGAASLADMPAYGLTFGGKPRRRVLVVEGEDGDGDADGASGGDEDGGGGGGGGGSNSSNSSNRSSNSSSNGSSSSSSSSNNCSSSSSAGVGGFSQRGVRLLLGGAGLSA